MSATEGDTSRKRSTIKARSKEGGPVWPRGKKRGIPTWSICRWSKGTGECLEALRAAVKRPKDTPSVNIITKKDVNATTR